MKKKLLTLLISCTVVLSLSACGSSKKTTTNKDSSKRETAQDTKEEKKEEVKDPVDLTGSWKSEENDGAWMSADITADTITVNWISDNGDTTAIYWVGTYQAPTEYIEEYSWTSERNKEQTDNALLASTDDTKDFTYSDATKELSYQVTMSGVTTTVQLTKVE